MLISNFKGANSKFKWQFLDHEYGDFNTDITKPASKDWFSSFVRDNFGLNCYDDPNQPTTPNRLCLDLILAKNVVKMVAQPITVYHIDHKAIVSTVTLTYPSISMCGV